MVVVHIGDSNDGCELVMVEVVVVIILVVVVVIMVPW